MPTREGFPVRHGPGVMPGPGDTHIAYGKGWANVSNTPFREYKHWVHEGGISTPLIAHWPQGIARRGELERQPGHLVDLMATCLDLAGAEYPRQLHGEELAPLAGRSLRPAFAGRPIERDALYWEHEGNRALRQGPWKLVAKGPAGAWELYNIEADRSELHNLASDKPELVAQLAEAWERWATKSQVLPWIWGGVYGAR
jgi:arylsulfatase